ncbi:MAG: hypothetical protein ACTSQP_15330 [Promethearchaeota archaeon]
MMELNTFLKEIEEITDINGCYLINIEDSKVISSTIPFQIPKEILWELSVLRDTFQNFAKGINHGNFLELMLEGDKGYIILYNISQHVILLALAPYEINLSYVKLAMIDILNRLREYFTELGEEVLEYKAIEEIKVREEIEVSESAVVQDISTEIKATPVEEQAPIMEKISPVEEIPQEQIKEEIIEEGENINDLIEKMAVVDSNEKYDILRKVFAILKQEIKNKTGIDIAKSLKTIVDGVLDNIGTSLALFDMSRTERELKKIEYKLDEDLINKYLIKIDNWASRIIK